LRERLTCVEGIVAGPLDLNGYVCNYRDRLRRGRYSVVSRERQMVSSWPRGGSDGDLCFPRSGRAERQSVRKRGTQRDRGNGISIGRYADPGSRGQVRWERGPAREKRKSSK